MSPRPSASMPCSSIVVREVAPGEAPAYDRAGSDRSGVDGECAATARRHMKPRAHRTEILASEVEGCAAPTSIFSEQGTPGHKCHDIGQPAGKALAHAPALTVTFGCWRALRYQQRSRCRERWREEGSSFACARVWEAVYYAGEKYAICRQSATPSPRPGVERLLPPSAEHIHSAGRGPTVVVTQRTADPGATCTDALTRSG